MNPVPQCLYNAGKLSTLHIYLNGNPQSDLFISYFLCGYGDVLSEKYDLNSIKLQRFNSLVFCLYCLDFDGM